MIELTCKTCGKLFSVKNYRANTALYCSKSCHCLGTIAGKNKTSVLKICIVCGKSYKRILSRAEKSHCCSIICHNRYIADKVDKRGDKNPMWKGGITTYRMFRKDKCEVCNSLKNLLVHHKDKNRYNNEPENLETLCKKCHQSIRHNCVSNLGVYAQRQPISET